MKILSTLFLIISVISLIMGIVWRIMQKPFPLGQIPPNSIMEFTAICLLFALAISVYQIANKS
ncbi:MAG: hypothetical protein HY811_06565 [Planctomycetes bacterium]|nr:hypothetical protein [Planctomycetota bacterium]